LTASFIRTPHNPLIEHLFYSKSVGMTDFLLERIHEEEQAWREGMTVTLPGFARLSARSAAECEARREVVEYCRGILARGPLSPEVQGVIYQILDRMTQPYAHHSDWSANREL